MNATSSLKRLSITRVARSAAIVGAAGILALGGLTACAGDDSSSTTDNAGETTALPSEPATGEPIKLGLITPEGGAVNTPMVREGAEAAVEFLNNNAGGINGHKIDLVVCKQQEEPASATKCANQMVQEKVAAVLSPLGAQGAVMLPIVTSAGIPYIAQAPVSQTEMVAPGSYMLTGGILAVLSGQAAIAAQDGVKSLTVLIGDTGDAAASVKALGDSIFGPAGIELKVVTVPLGTADPTPQITAGLADKPDAITILGDTNQCISSLKALQTVAPDVKKYLIASCLDKPVVDAVGLGAITGAKAFTTVNLSSQDSSVTQYRSAMAQYSPETDPAGLSYIGYQVFVALAEAGQHIAGVTKEDVHAAMSSATDVPLPAAPGITFTCNGTAMPMLKALCGKAILASDVNDEGTFENTVVVNK